MFYRDIIERYNVINIKLLEDYFPDIIHIHNYYHLLTSSIFIAIKKFKLKNHNCKVIMTVHDFHLICPSSHLLYYKNNKPEKLPIPIKKKFWLIRRVDSRSILHSFLKKLTWLFERLFIRPLRVIDFIITPSYFMSNTLVNSGIQNKIICIRNPLELGESEINIHQYPRLDDNIKMVFFGRLSKEKGLQEFFKMTIALKLNLSIDIYGDGPEIGELKHIVSNVSHLNINFLGSFPNEILQSKLKNYHVSIIPSIGYENAPLTIPEAAKAGLIIWGTESGGVREMCEVCNVPHFLFTCNNINEFKKSYHSLNSYLNSDHDYQVELKEFNVNNFVKETLTIYSSDNYK